jgi:DNA replication protein DnaD
MYPKRNYEMEENEDLDASEVDSHRSDDSNEVKRRFHDFMSHEIEILDQILVEMISAVENTSENTIISQLERCFECIDNMMVYANQFINQAQSVNMKYFVRFYSLYDRIRHSIMRTLTIINNLRKRNLFQMIPLVKDLTLDLDEIKVLVSRTTLEQVEEVLEGYRIKRSYIRRKVENFI